MMVIIRNDLRLKVVRLQMHVMVILRKIVYKCEQVQEKVFDEIIPLKISHFVVCKQYMKKQNLIKIIKLFVFVHLFIIIPMNLMNISIIKMNSNKQNSAKQLRKIMLVFLRLDSSNILPQIILSHFNLIKQKKKIVLGVIFFVVVVECF